MNMLRSGIAALIVGLAVLVPSPAPAAVAKTTITFEMPGCDGCEVRLVHASWKRGDGYDIRYWDSAKKVVDGDSVSFTIPTKHTKGMSVILTAPWEGHTGYLTTVAFRYGGMRPGDEVGFHDARSKNVASACWAGTDESEVTVPVTVRKVWVEGVRHRVRGSIAYASVTQDWQVPMRQAWDGVMGSQDVNVCGERRD